MCSILGYCNSKLSSNEIVHLNDSISHRGPDNFTVKEYIFNNKPLFMCHNKLSIKHWFRAELKDMVYSKIQNLDDRFNKKYLMNIFNEHQKGRNFEYVLWNVMRLK